MIVAAETTLIRNTRVHAETILDKKMPSHMCYHDTQHTKDVVCASYEIAKALNLPDEQIETIILGAWLHDTGYHNGNSDLHEDESINIARTFLAKENVDPERIEAVVGVIEATRIPQKPTNIMEEVICDADLYHLASDKYFEKSEQLKKEISRTKGMTLDDVEWFAMNVAFFEQHDYFTSYGKEVLQPKKALNLKKVKSRLKELKSDKKYVKALEKEVKKLREKATEENQRPTRGIETMFRITSKNHLTLSGMADNKANIMISINSIILSILMTVLTRKFDDYPNLIVPALILTITSLLTIVFAVLATRPNVSSGKFTSDDILNKRTNLLFFGNFHSMDLGDYEWGMKEMMKDKDYLYSSLIRDIYFLGIVLGKKYKLLRISYTVFMYGFVVSILSFMIASFFMQPV